MASWACCMWPRRSWASCTCHLTKQRVPLSTVDSGHRGTHSILEGLVLCAPKENFAAQVLQAPGDCGARKRWMAVGVSSPGGLPVGASLGSSPNLCFYKVIQWSESSWNLNSCILDPWPKYQYYKQEESGPWPRSDNHSCLPVCLAASHPKPATGQLLQRKQVLPISVLHYLTIDLRMLAWIQNLPIILLETSTINLSMKEEKL